MTTSGTIEVRGARTHNLKNISLGLPRGAFIVVTGPSGSGKSSLAFDTLYAEGERRYVESLSPRARQFLEQLPRADVDVIDGLPPAVAIGQTTGGLHPKSTVGTLTEIDDHLRLLYARAGTAYCPRHGLPLKAESVASMTDKVLCDAGDRRIAVAAPIDLGMEVSAKAFQALAAKLQTEGFQRVRIDGQIMHLDDVSGGEPLGDGAHVLELIVDRLRVRGDVRERIAQSLETALERGGGRAVVFDLDGEGENGAVWERRFSSKNACPLCDFAAGELEPGDFSRFSRRGACPHCGGTGLVDVLLAERLIVDPSKSLAGGAFAGNPSSTWCQMLMQTAAAAGLDVDAPWQQLPEAARRALLDAVQGAIEAYLRDATPSEKKVLSAFMTQVSCPDCDGSGLGIVGRTVRLDGQRFPELQALSIKDVALKLANLQLEGVRGEIVARAAAGARSKLACLENLGLDYLTLSRPGRTLSGGELERIRLAAQLGSGLSGVLYVLDEPTTGLHPKDAEALVQVLKRLQALGNTVLVVEHDRTVMEAADWLVDMGPGAGTAGGEVTAQGTLAALKANPHSLTGAWLSGQVQNALTRRHFNATKADKLELKGAVGRNLKNVNLTIPVGGLTVITGVSGSGKSTLIVDTLLPALKAVVSKDAKAAGAGLPFSELYGAEYFDQVVSVDQAPIGRSTRSNAASYTGAFTPIRELFAETLTARERGYSASRFSFLNHGGRCEACAGEGVVRVPMQFLPDLYVRCDVCGGARYNRETLECRWQGKSIADVLEMTVDDARDFFASHPQIMRRMDALADVGLGYIRLGQSTADFSGGEAQRLKLAAELSRLSSSRTFYLLDEPTTGLHFADVAKLLAVLRRLTDIGATVVVLEHDMQVAACADWVVDVGPGAGEAGGDITAQGTPSQVARMRKSLTASWLKDALKTLRS